jgi:hypothetical protein
VALGVLVGGNRPDLGTAEFHDGAALLPGTPLREEGDGGTEDAGDENESRGPLHS